MAVINIAVLQTSAHCIVVIFRKRRVENLTMRDYVSGLKSLIKRNLSPRNRDAFDIAWGTLGRCRDQLYWGAFNVREALCRHPIPVSLIRGTLEDCGIKRGDAIHVQASVSHLFRGHLKASEDSHLDIASYSMKVVQMLLELVGPSGTVCMLTDSARPRPGWLSRACADQQIPSDVFDYALSPSSSGLISEIFRRLDGVVRSVHPFYNTTVYGRFAEALVASNHLSTPYSQDRFSPWAKMLDLDATVILLGRTFDINSTVVLPEYLHPQDFPRPVFMEKPVRHYYIGRDRLKHSIDLFLHIAGSPAHQLCVPRSLFSYSEYLQSIYHLYFVRKFVPGVAIVTYRACAQYDAICSEIKNNITWYDPQFLPPIDKSC